MRTPLLWDILALATNAAVRCCLPFLRTCVLFSGGDDSLRGGAGRLAPGHGLYKWHQIFASGSIMSKGLDVFTDRGRLSDHGGTVYWLSNLKELCVHYRRRKI